MILWKPGNLREGGREEGREGGRVREGGKEGGREGGVGHTSMVSVFVCSSSEMIFRL